MKGLGTVIACSVTFSLGYYLKGEASPPSVITSSNQLERAAVVGNPSSTSEQFNHYTKFNLDNGYEPIVGIPPKPIPPGAPTPSSSSSAGGTPPDPTEPPTEHDQIVVKLNHPVKVGDAPRYIIYKWYKISTGISTSTGLPDRIEFTKVSSPFGDPGFVKVASGSIGEVIKNVNVPRPAGKHQYALCTWLAKPHPSDPLKFMPIATSRMSALSHYVEK